MVTSSIKTCNAHQCWSILFLQLQWPSLVISSLTALTISHHWWSILLPYLQLAITGDQILLLHLQFIQVITGDQFSYLTYNWPSLVINSLTSPTIGHHSNHTWNGHHWWSILVLSKQWYHWYLWWLLSTFNWLILMLYSYTNYSNYSCCYWWPSSQFL